mmetsp:Transcript_1569/g.5398  ORF Transcript_1569/g.5398 Transcript_1569/m.5398 type:complete len:114 (-) Transcript_1569:29-370(-)
MWCQNKFDSGIDGHETVRTQEKKHLRYLRIRPTGNCKWARSLCVVGVFFAAICRAEGLCWMDFFAITMMWDIDGRECAGGGCDFEFARESGKKRESRFDVSLFLLPISMGDTL